MHRTRLSLAIRSLVPRSPLGNAAWRVADGRKVLGATGLAPLAEIASFSRRYKSDLEQLDDLLFSLAQERKVPEVSAAAINPNPSTTTPSPPVGQAPTTKTDASPASQQPPTQSTSSSPNQSPQAVAPTPATSASTQVSQAVPSSERRQGSDRFRQGHDGRGRGRGRGGSGSGRFDDSRHRGQGQQSKNPSVRVEDIEPGSKPPASSPSTGATSPSGSPGSLNELRTLVEAASGESVRLQQQLDAETAALKALKEEQLQAVPLIQRQAVAPAPGLNPLPLAKTESLTAGQLFTPIAPTSSDPQTVTTICHVATTSMVGELIHNVTEVFEDANNGAFVELVLKVRRTPLEFRTSATSVASSSVKQHPFGTPQSDENGQDCDYFPVRCFGQPFLSYAQAVLRKGDLVHVMGQLMCYKTPTMIAFSDEGKVGLRNCGVEAGQALTTVAVSVAEGGGVLNLVFGLPTAPQVARSTSEIDAEEIASV